MNQTRCVRLVTAVVAMMCVSTALADGLRVVTWNVTNYSSGRVSEFQTAIYASFMGRSMAPDVIVGQEFLSQTGVNNFLSILNNAPGSPGDWAAGPFQNGNDTDNAFFYRTTRVDFLGMTVVSQGSGSPNHPRDLNRYDVRLEGYGADEAVIAMYSSHMKAGSGSSDQARRLVEAQALRDDAESLPAGWTFLIGADFNIQSSSQSAYVEMVGSQANNDGRFFDPIATPGSWNNNSFYRYVHTQDPSGAGGMDDRHDQILVSGDLVDGDGLDYLGNPSIPYSTSTWDDPNHSYRSWGNDGTSYNVQLTIAGNAMVGSTIAQALVDSAPGGGHLPVVLNFAVPAVVDADTLAIDFGTVPMGSVAQQTIMIGNDGDVVLWGANGIDDLDYSMSTTSGFTAPGGSFVDGSGGSYNSHTIEMDTSSSGTFNGTLTIISDDVDTPNLVVTLTGVVDNGGMPEERFLLSFRQTTLIPGAPKAFPHDIVCYDVNTGTWVQIFDGSDVGANAVKISGFSVIDGGTGPEIVMSFFGPTTIPGLIGGPGGSEDVDNSDMVRFVPTSLGETTAGAFHFYFDGSDVSLTINAENVDALDVDTNGDIYMSMLQRGNLDGLPAPDEDIMLFVPSSIGESTAGVWSRYIDGSDIGLADSSREDIDAIALDPAGGDVFISTLGPASMPGPVSGDDEDVFRFSPTMTGETTTGTWTLEHDLSAIGIDPIEDIGGMDVLDYDILSPPTILDDDHVPQVLPFIPLCPGDFNMDDVADSRDVVDFLNAFVAGDREADFDMDGLLTTSDLIAFLNVVGVCR